jgi:hypothetical protein
MVETKLRPVVAACEKHWESHKSDCSGFVKAVAAELGVALTGQANDILKSLANPPWRGLADGAEAQSKAAQGYLVLGGLEASTNGHVVVVVPGVLNRGKYPSAYWGSLGTVGRKNTTINLSWTERDRDRVAYFYHSTKQFSEPSV